jgi:hypothetical protein
MFQWLQNLSVICRNSVSRGLLGAGLVGALAGLPAPALAQSAAPAAIRPANADPSVHQMVIYNGPTRTVRYFAPGASPTEQAALKQMEQAENELALSDSQQALRQQYVNTESLMEARRREVQRKLYGLSITDKVSSSASYSGVGLGQPSPYGTPLAGSTLGWMGYPGGYPYSAYSGDQVTFRRESETNQSLANGIGDEGQFKRAMVTEMARQANPEAAATALRNYESARANLASFRPGGVVAASAESTTPQRVIVTLKDGEKLSGSLVREDAGWITLRTKHSEERIRLGDVNRIQMEVSK